MAKKDISFNFECACKHTQLTSCAGPKIGLKQVVVIECDNCGTVTTLKVKRAHSIAQKGQIPCEILIMRIVYSEACKAIMHRMQTLANIKKDPAAALGLK